MSAVDLCSGRCYENYQLRALLRPSACKSCGLLSILLSRVWDASRWTEAYYSPDAPDAILQSYRCGGRSQEYRRPSNLLCHVGFG